MSNLLEGLMGHLDENAVGQIAQQLGVDQATAQQGVGAALPLLLSAMNRNAQTDQGAQALSGALSNDHNGGVLGDVVGAISGFQGGPGAAILGHLLGGQQQQVGNQLGQSLGLNGPALLQMLAPIVMGYLGQQQQSQGLNAAGLAGLLLNNQQGMQQHSAGGGAMGLIGQLLDANHDGSPLDDVLGMAQKFLFKR
jgi:hypothetical protein